MSAYGHDCIFAGEAAVLEEQLNDGLSQREEPRRRRQKYKERKLRALAKRLSERLCVFCGSVRRQRGQEDTAHGDDKHP
jgi:hypothetical protein